MSIRLIHGDCREVLATLPAESVHCCVTSPPYFGLRDYGTGTWEGGRLECDHANGFVRKDADRERITAGPERGGSGSQATAYFKDVCKKCGARRTDRQIGIEPTPDAYVATLVEVFRQVRRVLRNDGTLWLNLGDSYASAPKGNPGALSNGLTNNGRCAAEANQHRTRSTIVGGLKPKDLIGIPWRVAFALQADGWYLRSDIIWAKPNPMPESVTDRPTKAHEYLFLLAKSERYYYDAAAIAETASNDSGFARQRERGVNTWDYGRDGYNEQRLGGMSGKETFQNRDTRNRRSVWTVATQPFSEAHFATFPPALIEPCILAGCPSGGTVLDPFGGAGTTGLVADRLQRNAILIELNPEYSDMAERRIVDDGPLFADVAAIRLRLEATPDAVRHKLEGA